VNTSGISTWTSFNTTGTLNLTCDCSGKYTFTSSGRGAIDFSVADKELGLTSATLSLSRASSSSSDFPFLNLTGPFKGASYLTGTLACDLEPVNNILGSMTLSGLGDVSVSYLLTAMADSLDISGGTFQTVANDMLDITFESLTLNISVCCAISPPHTHLFNSFFNRSQIGTSQDKQLSVYGG
jgi:hypothetical protein